MRYWFWLPAFAVLAADMQPFDVVRIDVSQTGPQYELHAKIHTTPKWVFSFFRGTNVWDVTGKTVRLVWGRDAGGPALADIAGSIAGNTATFAVTSTNVIAEPIACGWSVIYIEGQCVAVGVVHFKRGPEIEYLLGG